MSSSTSTPTKDPSAMDTPEVLKSAYTGGWRPSTTALRITLRQSAGALARSHPLPHRSRYPNRMTAAQVGPAYGIRRLISDSGPNNGLIAIREPPHVVERTSESRSAPLQGGQYPYPQWLLDQSGRPTRVHTGVSA